MLIVAPFPKKRTAAPSKPATVTQLRCCPGFGKRAEALHEQVIRYSSGTVMCARCLARDAAWCADQKAGKR